MSTSRENEKTDRGPGNTLVTMAILGATGHIAKGLIAEFNSSPRIELLLYARRPEAVEQFVEGLDCRHATPRIEDLDEFGKVECDVIINAIGAADPQQVERLKSEIQDITQSFDDKVLSHIKDSLKTCYIFLSSGIVHAADQPNTKVSPYAAAKIAAEQRHRSLLSQNIVDIRVFSFFSRYIDLSGDFFMAAVARAVVNEQAFQTQPATMMRDYSVPSDLAALIEKIIDRGPMNCGIDLYSSKPAEKFELLDRISRQFGLRYSIEPISDKTPPSPIKNGYYSKDHMATALGFEPQFDTINGVISELAEIVSTEVDRKELLESLYTNLYTVNVE